MATPPGHVLQWHDSWDAAAHGRSLQAHNLYILCKLCLAACRLAACATLYHHARRPQVRKPASQPGRLVLQTRLSVASLVQGLLPMQPFSLSCPPARLRRFGHTPLMAALTQQHTTTVKALMAGGARMTSSGSDFTTNWPSSATWNPTAASSKEAIAAKLTPGRIAECQAMCAHPPAPG